MSASSFTSDLAARLREAGIGLLELHSAAESQPGLEPAANIPTEELTEATVLALAEPLEFPPLNRALVPGDHVAIPVDEATPGLPQVVAGAIEAFRQAGAELENVAVVTADEATAQLLTDYLEQTEFAAVRLVVHDPIDENKLCFVGATQTGEALLMNRTVYEADVVLPIGCARHNEVLGSAGVFDSLYPRFCDVKTLREWRTLKGVDRAAQASWKQQADEAGWLLGVPMIVEVVPGPGGGVYRVLAGEVGAVARQSQRLCQELWSKSVPRPASLVIATVASNGLAAGWADVARAAQAAAPILQHGGALAVCCEHLARPGKSVQRLVDIDDPESVERQLRNDSEVDTWSAWQLCSALERGPVYLFTDLDEETVEDLGMAPVSSFEELTRLASRHEACVVLEQSHHVVAGVSGGSL